MSVAAVSAPVGDGDPTAVVIAYLRAHPALAAVTVSGQNRPPYPALMVTDPASLPLGTARRILSTTLQFDLFDDLLASSGRAALKPLAYAVIDALRDLPDVPYNAAAAAAVITDVDFGTLGWQPLLAQGRYLFRATLHSHPGP